MIVVFVGPSLDLASARATLDASYEPPARQGDVLRAVTCGAEAIGIIDGYFDWTLSVWHKEILWALTQGTHVYGAASMGALRAAELETFGMRGVGRIFELFRDGILEDDDEVAVAHEPGAGYATASEAMINIRLTLREAAAARVISDRTRRRMIAVAKRLFYPDRRYEWLLELGRERALPGRELDDLEAWIASNRVDQKRADALLLLEKLNGLDPRRTGPHRPQFELADSVFLERLLTNAETPGLQ
ncbi:MAG: TfuA-like protein [Solirubrobacteraceae bacterium]